MPRLRHSLQHWAWLACPVPCKPCPLEPMQRRRALIARAQPAAERPGAAGRGIPAGERRRRAPLQRRLALAGDAARAALTQRAGAPPGARSTLQCSARRARLGGAGSAGPFPVNAAAGGAATGLTPEACKGVCLHGGTELRAGPLREQRLPALSSTSRLTRQG